MFSSVSQRFGKSCLDSLRLVPHHNVFGQGALLAKIKMSSHVSVSMKDVEELRKLLSQVEANVKQLGEHRNGSLNSSNSNSNSNKDAMTNISKCQSFLDSAILEAQNGMSDKRVRMYENAPDSPTLSHAESFANEHDFLKSYANLKKQSTTTVTKWRQTEILSILGGIDLILDTYKKNGLLTREQKMELNRLEIAYNLQNNQNLKEQQLFDTQLPPSLSLMATNDKSNNNNNTSNNTSNNNKDKKVSINDSNNSSDDESATYMHGIAWSSHVSNARRFKPLNNKIHLACFEHGVAGCQVSLIMDGVNKYNYCWGYKDIKYAILGKMTHDTLIRIASISKTVTATAMLFLLKSRDVQINNKDPNLNNKFTLNSSIYDVLSNTHNYQLLKQFESFETLNKYKNIIKIKHLLTHQSGLRHYKILDEFEFHCGTCHNPNGSKFNSPKDNDNGNNGATKDDSTVTNGMAGTFEILSLFGNDPLLFEPGTGYNYSAFGYQILGMLIESICGLNFYTFVRRYLSLQLDMYNTHQSPLKIQAPKTAPQSAKNQSFVNSSNFSIKSDSNDNNNNEDERSFSGLNFHWSSRIAKHYKREVKSVDIQKDLANTGVKTGHQAASSAQGTTTTESKDNKENKDNSGDSADAHVAFYKEYKDISDTFLNDKFSSELYNAIVHYKYSTGGLISNSFDIALYGYLSIIENKLGINYEIDYNDEYGNNGLTKNTDYGYGWHILDNGNIYFHTGGAIGGVGIVKINKKKKMSIAVLCNTQTSPDLVHKIAKKVEKYFTKP